MERKIQKCYQVLLQDIQQYYPISIIQNQGKLYFNLFTESAGNELWVYDSKLGDINISAKIYAEGEKRELKSTITVLSSSSPKVYTYKIINEYPHDIKSYTQGLEFYKSELYESTGQKGESKLRKVDYKTGKVLKNIDLDPNYFGEGLTIFNNQIYQLTWQSRIGFVYNIDSFERISSFKYNKSPKDTCFLDFFMF